VSYRAGRFNSTPAATERQFGYGLRRPTVRGSTA